MVKVPTNHFPRLKKWPLYRGTRAGHQVPIQVITAGIQPSGPRTLNIKSQLRRSHNPSNCVCITPSQPSTSARRDNNFVLSLFLSNVMSLAPKIDELAHVVLNANFDLVCITKTWLQKHIPDSTVTIQGYNLIHLDRNEAYTTCVRILK